jgi:predicted esterase
MAMSPHAHIKRKGQNAQELFAGMGMGDQQDMLSKLHELRMKSYAVRENRADAAKPHLPLLNTNEKEQIIEQFYAAKKQLNRI